MKIGIIGLSQSGKTTIFQLLTGIETKAGTRTNIGVAKVLDPRVTKLAEIYKPKKTTRAKIEFIDIAGLVPGQNNNGRDFLANIRDVDAVVQVIGAFNLNTELIKEVDQIQSELIIADWSLLETRLERLAKERSKHNTNKQETTVLSKCKAALETEVPLRALDFTPDETKIISGYNFMTHKPLIIVVNVDDKQMQTQEYPQKQEFEAWAANRDVSLITMSAKEEVEINQLDQTDKAMFMADMGIKATGIERLSRVVYAHLGLISYFTVGEDEVRAWTISQGMTAKEGAGKIHSDIARGFIRAEVVTYEDFISYGSMSGVKEAGLFRLEGKEYIIKDGDIISFRFNV